MSPARGSSRRTGGAAADARTDGHTSVREEAERLREREAAQRENPELVAGRGRDTGERALGAEEGASGSRTVAAKKGAPTGTSASRKSASNRKRS